MPKVIYTEKDIEEMFKRGQLSLEMSEQTGLTDLAFERAHRLGVRLVNPAPENPPAAPVRPYISNRVEPQNARLTSTDQGELAQRIRKAVQTKLDGQVDADLLDTIIRRVLESTGVK
jgi:hypothetical protein